MDDRRRATRFRTTERCWFDTGDVLRFVAFKNISASGAMVETLSHTAAGEFARLRWKVDGNEEISVDARVVWIKAGPDGCSHVGLLFEHVHTPEALTNFIRKREIDPTCALESFPTSTPTSKP